MDSFSDFVDFDFSQFEGLEIIAPSPSESRMDSEQDEMKQLADADQRINEIGGYCNQSSGMPSALNTVGRALTLLRHGSATIPADLINSFHSHNPSLSLCLHLCFSDAAPKRSTLRGTGIPRTLQHS
ncbi:hypothetical protein D9619_009300 [Psilocybe cf. subviscida]|uniref:Uncharacterized protein n=1 Tax=Psilocybe cf. subviscida TaxID=2480587 RepID=A0A8H5BU53_9AGAR|nr:hypothetical protein D9619_009300 [Psilocybe cf. subviscida]